MTSDYPSLSVVIPTCDRPLFLRDALSSVMAQSRPAYEVLVVDNGTTPVAAPEWPPGQNIRLIRALPRFGVAQARNLGGILATGDYIAFLDDDDMWHAEYLLSVAKTIQATGADIVLGRLRSMSGGHQVTGMQVNVIDHDLLIQELLKRNPGVVGSNTTIRRSTFSQTAGYDTWLTTGEDKALVLDLLMKNCSIACAGGAWVNRRREHDAPRLTGLHDMSRGKFRFLNKYWRLMPIGTRLRNLLMLCCLRVRIISARSLTGVEI